MRGARRWLVGCVVAGCASLALVIPAHTQTVSEERWISPLLPYAARCKLRGAHARSHAIALERLAIARWQRVPFAIEEAPRATQQMAESAACYVAASDRAGHLRASTLQRRFQSETLRRFAQARVGLHERDARTSAATLLALLEHAPETARQYRERMAQLARRGDVP